jgi:hypothetical protein
MNIEVVTRQDFLELKADILDEIRLMLSGVQTQTESKWLRSAQVRKMLAISPGTLQNLRIQGLLAFNKVGGTFFYHRNDIERMLSKNGK